MSNVVYYLDEQCTAQLNKSNPSMAKNVTKQHHFAKKSNKASSSSDFETTKQLGQLVKQLINKYYKRTSWTSTIFRTLFMIILGVSAFFYWDTKYNKSLYTKTIEKELAKYGLLEYTWIMINSVKKYYLKAKSLAYYYVPIWYSKIMPYTKQAVEFTKEYSLILWKKCGELSIVAMGYMEYYFNYVSIFFYFILFLWRIKFVFYLFS